MVHTYHLRIQCYATGRKSSEVQAYKKCPFSVQSKVIVGTLHSTCYTIIHKLKKNAYKDRIKNLLIMQATQALWRAVVKCNHTLAAHWFKTYAYQAHAETLFNACRLFLTYSWVVAFSKTLWIVQVSDILYLSLSISADCLLPVNKVEIVKGSTQLRDNIKRFCQITCYNCYKRVYCDRVPLKIK